MRTGWRQVELKVAAAASGQLALSHGGVDQLQVARLVVRVRPVLCHRQLAEVLNVGGRGVWRRMQARGGQCCCG